MNALMEQLRVDECLSDLSEELAAIGPLSLRQRATVKALSAATRVLRLRAIANDRAAFAQRFAAPSSRELNIRTRPHSGIDDDTRMLFERTGVAGPLRVCAEDEARELADHIRALLRDPHNPLRRQIAAHNERRAREMAAREDILLGFNAFMYDARVREVLLRPPIVEAMQALMATNRVACWRSQVFRQRLGVRTPMHQNVEFPETYGHRSLTLRPNRVFRPNSALNAWISLTHAGPDNGCLVVLAGTFRDTRVYDLGAYFAQHPTALLTCLAFFPRHEVERMLPVLLYGSGNHRGVTKLMLRFADFFHDDLFAQEVSRCDFVSRPGELWVFTSFAMHGSMPSQTDAERLTLVGRYIDEQDIAVGQNELVLSLGEVVRIDPHTQGWCDVARADTRPLRDRQHRAPARARTRRDAM